MSMSSKPDPDHDDVIISNGGEVTTPIYRGWHHSLIPLVAGLLVLIALALLTFSLQGGTERGLFPILPTITTSPGTIDSEIAVIGFSELNEDPAAFRGKRIQVSGAYTPMEAPECLDYIGPTIRWSLVAEELQLNAIGFENLVRLLEPGAEMTVSGVWSAYQGPVGCGKEPPDGTIWYLAVERIVEPNPLFGAQAPALTVIAGEELPTLSPLETFESRTPMPTLEATPEISPTMTLDAAATLPLPLTETPDPTTLPVTPLFTPGVTPGQTGTPPPGTTPEGSPTFGPSPTPDPAGTPTPGLPISTPSGTGYPIGPSPTATTGGYP